PPLLASGAVLVDDPARRCPVDQAHQGAGALVDVPLAGAHRRVEALVQGLDGGAVAQVVGALLQRAPVALDLLLDVGHVRVRSSGRTAAYPTSHAGGRRTFVAVARAGARAAPPSRPTIARSTAVFAFWTAASRVAGLIREIVAAALFGTRGPINAFVIAFQVPNLLRSLVADSALSAAFVPVFTELEEKGR